MKPEETALILIGYQNDYFAEDGILHGVIEESSRINGTLANTLKLMDALESTPVLMITTPIIFTPDYSELIGPVGILKTIKDVGAFKHGTDGARTIAEFEKYGSRIIEVPGKRGLNAFSNTDLQGLLRERGIKNLVLAGTVISICIDSTGRSAHERGFKVFVLSDCTSGRTKFEQDYYCNEVLPLYAGVIPYQEFLDRLGIPALHGQAG